MPNVEGSAKQQRKERAWLWVKRHPNGVTRSELEPLTGIRRKTLDNYLRELEYEGKITKEGALWFPLNFEGTRLRSFDLAPEEAYTLYLATRLLVKQQDKRNEPAETALMKLAHILTSDAGVGAEIAQAAQELASRQPDRGYQSVFRTLVRGYIYRKAVRVTYRPLNGRPFDTVFRTYLMEPSAIGFSTYAIGHSRAPNALRAYKMERIQAAELTREGYSIPNDFPGLDILRNAWSIISGDETVRVVLRFSPAVRERVLETQWHPSQEYGDDAEKPGWLRWWVDVANTLDMLPWIRGWGADVEVVGPVRLRETLIGEVKKLSLVYHLGQIGSDNYLDGESPMDTFHQYLTLPGKTEPFLTIFEHSSDVFHVVLYLLSENITNVHSPHLVKAGALLHDVGKIEQDIQAGRQWIHQPHSAKYLYTLLDHPRMSALLSDNGIDISELDYTDLLLICEHHHDIPTQPALLRRCPDALLISIADVIASAIESGWAGNIRKMLSAGAYIDLNLSLLGNFGLDNGLDDEIHRVDLPGDSVADALLNDLIFRDMSRQLRDHNLKPLLQKGGSLWVVGKQEILRFFLQEYMVNPRTLYESAHLADEIFEGVLATMPAPGMLQLDTIRYLLVNERIARKVSQGLIDRKQVRQALEHFDISVNSIHEAFGARGQTLTDKLEAVSENPRYLITGAQAAYQYHRWRMPSAGVYELLIKPADFDTWYSYLRDSHIFVGKRLPSGQESERYREVVVLAPELSDELWKNRVWIDGVAYIAPTDLVFQFLATQTEATIGEAIAILVARQQIWNWDELIAAIKAKRMVRQFGCLFEIINLEVNRVVIPIDVTESLFALVQDTVGEAVFTFPLRKDWESPLPGPIYEKYTTIGRRWGLDIRLPRSLVAKVLDDLGV